MSRLEFDSVSDRIYSVGIDNCVLYLENIAVPWNGITNISASPYTEEMREFYIDGIQYLKYLPQVTYTATVEAFNAPSEFGPYYGKSQKAQGLYEQSLLRPEFGMCYRTLLGNDVEGDAYGYELHLIYQLSAMLSPLNNETINKSSAATSKIWNLRSRPIVAFERPRATHFMVDSTEADPDALVQLENYLYGTDTTSAAMPSPSTVFNILNV